MKKLFFSLISVIIAHVALAQVAINSTNTPPDASAMLDISSTSKGLLVPRLTEAQRDAIASPATGLLIYQTDNTTGFYMYNGTAWSSLADNLGNHTATKAFNIANFRIHNSNPQTGLRLDAYGGFILRTQPTPSNSLPGTMMSMDHDGGLVVRGTIGVGSAPASGPGARMMWYPGKVAFRAAAANDFEMDEPNLGYYSASFGNASIGSGNYSFTAGDHPVASGGGAIAMGINTEATGNSSVALGALTRARARYSTALGYNNVAHGYASTVVGVFNDSVIVNPQVSVSTSTPLFIIGNGDNATARSNAVVVQKDGRIFLDPSNKNNGTVSSNALVFGTANGSGEGIASVRTATTNQYGLDFYTSFTNRLSITNTGKIGVGTNAPSARFDIVGANNWDLNGGEGDLRIGNNDFRLKIGVALAGSGRGGVGIMQYGQPNLYNVLALGAQGNNLLFLNGNSTNVGIGTDNPSQKLTVAGNICATGSIGACSDIRYKTNILPVSNALTSLLLIHGIYYNWKKEFKDKGFTNDRQIGFSAQEIEKLFPEMVQTDAEGYKAVDYSRMAPVLVEAIREQQSVIENQQKEIEQVKKQSEEQQKDIELLKKQMAEMLKKQ